MSEVTRFCNYLRAEGFEVRDAGNQLWLQKFSIVYMWPLWFSGKYFPQPTLYEDVPIVAKGFSNERAMRKELTLLTLTGNFIFLRTFINGHEQPSSVSDGCAPDPATPIRPLNAKKKRAIDDMAERAAAKRSKTQSTPDLRGAVTP
jgi:hypothetical protein